MSIKNFCDTDNMPSMDELMGNNQEVQQFNDGDIIKGKVTSKNDKGVYNPYSSLKPNYKMAVAWQYSSKGRVNGISGDVDLNLSYLGY